MSAEPRFEVALTRDPDIFAEHVTPLLEERLECNVMATVLARVRRAGDSRAAPLFAYACGADGRPVLAAMRTPPWPLLTSDFDPALAGPLVARWRTDDPHVPGVSGPPRAVRALTAEWREQTGRPSRCVRLEAMHATDRIADPPFPVQGAARVAGLEDRTLLMAWMVDFHREALGIEDARTAASVDDRLATGDLFVWERGGAPVSVVGLNGPVAGVVRIGPVYTPPALRGHGYASAAVAAASRAALTRGAHTCMLLTDLANPTSNKIYAALGYRRFGDWEEHELD